MMEEINRIKTKFFQQLSGKIRLQTAAIQEWMGSVIRRLNQADHSLLKEATALLELALWKANLDYIQRER